MHKHSLTPGLHCTRNGAKGKKVDFVLFITFEWLLNFLISCLVRASQEMTDIDTVIREVEGCCGVCCRHRLALLERWSLGVFSSSSVRNSAKNGITVGKLRLHQLYQHWVVA